MYKEQWEIKLAVWRDQLVSSLDLAEVARIHFIAEEQGQGEIHRFIAVEKTEAIPQVVITRIISQLATFLDGHDPKRMRVKALRWVNRPNAEAAQD
jgi:hypothetical protein